MENRPIIILGISALYHDSAVTLLKDGRVLGAVQEERFSRIKGDSKLPKESINFLLGKFGIKPSEITAIAYYENPSLKLERILTTLSLGKLNNYALFVKSIKNWFPNKYLVATAIKKIMKVEIPIFYLNHHLSHASSAFFPSPFEEAAYLTLDGVGEWDSTSWGYGKGNTLECYESIEYPNSLGILYSAFTYYCGFKINSGEYKLMGLAPYGKPRFAEVIRRELLQVNENGSYALNPKYFDYMSKNKTFNKAFEELFGEKARGKGELGDFHADIAASIQLVLNECILAMAKHVSGELLVKGIASKNLVLAGGVALNVTAMGLLESSKIFENIWIQPASGDAGGSLGAAFYLYYHLSKEVRGAYDARAYASTKDYLLGPEGADFEFNEEKSILLYKVKVKAVAKEESLMYLAKALEDGKVIGIYQGRGEFGPRALGARSIIASAKEEGMREKLNAKVKLRENFRPFAPIALMEDFKMYYQHNDSDSPYMLKSYFLKEEFRGLAPELRGSSLERIAGERGVFPAVTHVDYSARVQTVTGDLAPYLFNLLKAYREHSGVGVLVNTSFNLKNEPVCNSPIDALECFIKSEIDILVLGENIILKSENLGLKSLVKRKHRDD